MVASTFKFLRDENNDPHVRMLFLCFLDRKVTRRHNKRLYEEFWKAYVNWMETSPMTAGKRIDFIRDYPKLPGM